MRTRSHGSFIYLLMIGLFGVGLWIILSFGSIVLRAPEDLAGQWELYAPTAAPGDDSLLDMRVDQSGRFFKITLAGRRLDLRLMEEERYDRHAQRRTRLKLVANSAEAVFEGKRGGDEFLLELESPILRGTWLARRTDRTYVRVPKEESARGRAPADVPHARR